MRKDCTVAPYVLHQLKSGSGGVKGARYPCKSPSPLPKPAGAPRKQQWVGVAPGAEENGRFGSCLGWQWCWTWGLSSAAALLCNLSPAKRCLYSATAQWLLPFSHVRWGIPGGATFFAGLPVLLSISGSRRPQLPGDFCTLCSVTWGYEYLFFQGLGVWFVFFSLFNLQYKCHGLGF